MKKLGKVLWIIMKMYAMIVVIESWWIRCGITLCRARQYVEAMTGEPYPCGLKSIRDGVTIGNKALDDTMEKANDGWRWYIKWIKELF